MIRKLASIRKINDVLPIPNADLIEVAVIDGWKVVIKKNEFEVNDLVVYCEIDSWIPHELAPFLSKGKDPREYEGIKGERLRTVKLRGQISQGLILSRDILPSIEYTWQEGDDVSEILNIQKYEPPVPACLAGEVRGLFPSFIPKTDQERIQNLTKEFEDFKNYMWEIAEKLDGSSCTIYYKDIDFGVCSRNLNLKPTENNTFWSVAVKNDLESKLRNLGKNLAIQGEVIGEGIQGNPYKIKGQQFYVFDIFDIDRQEYYNSVERLFLTESLELAHTPIVCAAGPITLTNTIAEILNFAEGKSELNIKTEREGLVFKCIQDPSLSFKAISNKFLIKHND